MLGVAELGELLVIRFLAVCRKTRVAHFNRALFPMQHRAAMVAFMAVSGHMLQDVLVALVRLEPHST